MITMKNHDEEVTRLLSYRDKKLYYELKNNAEKIRIISKEVAKLRAELAEARRQELIRRTGIKDPDPKVVYL